MDEIKKKAGGKRVGAGRPALVRLNNERQSQGLEPIYPKPKPVKPRESKAILPVAKKLRHQEILAEMLGLKSKQVVAKVLQKALNDGDADQLACLKIVMDRILPADYITKSANKSNGITIQIMGVDSPIVNVEETEAIDIDYEEVE